MRPDVSRIDLLADPPRAVRVRFELAAGRLAEAWVRAGRIRVSADDFALAREFLVREGWEVEDLPGLQVQLAGPAGAGDPLSREEAMVIALRHLAARSGRRRRSFFRPAATAPGWDGWTATPPLAAVSVTPGSDAAASPSGWTA